MERKITELVTRAESLGIDCSDLGLLKTPDNFKILRKLCPTLPMESPSNCVKIMVLDTETTGTDFEKHSIIELGYSMVEYSPSSRRLHNVVKQVSMLQDPGEPLTPEIVKITGITDEDLKGNSINLSEVEADLAEARLVIAHNANFDRKFVEKLSPAFVGKPWACSISDIDWKAFGITSNKLDYIAYQLGFYFDAHRALNDVMAVIEILRMQDALVELVKNTNKTTTILGASGAPISVKDMLKERGYKALYKNGKFIMWYTTLDNDAAITEEKEFLTKKAHCIRIPEKVITAYDRYSVRDTI